MLQMCQMLWFGNTDTLRQSQPSRLRHGGVSSDDKFSGSINASPLLNLPGLLDLELALLVGLLSKAYKVDVNIIFSHLGNMHGNCFHHLL